MGLQWLSLKSGISAAFSAPRKTPSAPDIALQGQGNNGSCGPVPSDPATPMWSFLLDW